MQQDGFRKRGLDVIARRPDTLTRQYMLKLPSRPADKRLQHLTRIPRSRSRSTRKQQHIDPTISLAIAVFTFMRLFDSCKSSVRDDGSAKGALDGVEGLSEVDTFERRLGSLGGVGKSKKRR